MQGRRTSWAGSRSSIGRQRLGMNAVHKAQRAVQRFVEAMCRSVAIRARLSKRKGKEQFSSAWAVVCISFWPSFLKSYTADGQFNAINLGLWSRVTPWVSVEDDLECAKPGKYSSRSQAGQAKVSEGRKD